MNATGLPAPSRPVAKNAISKHRRRVTARDDAERAKVATTAELLEGVHTRGAESA